MVFFKQLLGTAVSKPPIKPGMIGKALIPTRVWLAVFDKDRPATCRRRSWGRDKKDGDEHLGDELP